MSRLDWKRGRFDSDYETNDIFSGLDGYQDVFGDYLDYYRFDREESTMDDIYDEATGVSGRQYKPAIQIPAIHVTHIEGENKNGDMGFYYNDTVEANFSFKTLQGVGLTLADIRTGNYLKDRVVYDDKVFRVEQLSIEGQIQRRDIIVNLRATQMKPDELIDDPNFKRWSD